MRFIPTRVHGVLDYLVGLLLIAAPWVLGFAAGGAETWIPVVLGAGVILYSLMTNYELGVIRRIEMPVHLWFDGLGGAFLAVSPWVFGFSHLVWIPHVVVGVFEILTALSTQTRPVLAPRYTQSVPPARVEPDAHLQ